MKRAFYQKLIVTLLAWSAALFMLWFGRWKLRRVEEAATQIASAPL